MAIMDIQSKDYGTQLLAISLQGIVNRKAEEESIYLVTQEHDRKWINYYKNNKGLSTRQFNQLSDLLSEFKEYVKGYTIIDYQVPETIDLATTIAGLDDAIILPPDFLPLAKEAGLNCVNDLRGKFRGMSRVEVYRWGYHNLWSDEELSKKIIGTLEGLPTWFNIDLSPYIGENGKVYVKFQDATPKDGYGAAVKHVYLENSLKQDTQFEPDSKKEENYLYQTSGSWISPDGSRVADRAQSWTYRFKLKQENKSKIFIKNRRIFDYLIKVKGSTDDSWNIVIDSSQAETKSIIGHWVNPEIRDFLISRKAFAMTLSSFDSHPEERELRSQFFSDMEVGGRVFGWVTGTPEISHVSQVNNHGLTVVTSSWAPNFSLHQRMPADMTFQQNNIDKDLKLEDKIYLTFFVSDGDALWCVNNGFDGLWDSSIRGKIPLGWEMPEQLLEFGPAMLEYYYEKGSRQDYFVGSTSGDGYIYPSEFPKEHMENYLDRSNQQLEKLDMRTIQVLNNTSATSIETMRSYQETMTYPSLFIEGYHEIPGGTLELGEKAKWTRIGIAIDQIDNKGLPSSQDLLGKLRDIANSVDFRPLFIPIHIVITGPDTLKKLELAQNLTRQVNENDFKVVHPGDMAYLMNQQKVTKNTITIKFNRAKQPSTNDPRKLSAVINWFRFYDSPVFVDPVFEIDLDNEQAANRFLGAGFYRTENWSLHPEKDRVAWTGTSSATAIITTPPELGLKYLEFEAMPIEEGIEADIYFNGDKIRHIQFEPNWHKYSVKITD
ncbi:hypothetical protein KGY79_11845 [Candidatus Bipolaricaulota bacterium]|nr:hypothetical protein [Candidatus Bipolaricaulota bacterium]